MKKITSIFFAVCAVMLILTAPSEAGDRQKIIIDMDAAMGYAFHDIDDGLMALIALNSPELEIVGITAVWGNYTQEKTLPKQKKFWMLPEILLYHA